MSSRAVARSVVLPRSGAGFVDVKGQPSGPLSGLRAPLSARPVRSRPPVVISSTTDDVSYSDAGRRPRRAARPLLLSCRDAAQRCALFLQGPASGTRGPVR